MERFINSENIKNYRKQLSEPGIDKDPIRRLMLVRLLAGELAKRADAELASGAEELLATQRELSSAKFGLKCIG